MFCHISLLQAQAGVVREAMKSPQASVRHCGTRVFRLLGGDTLPEATASPAQASAAPQPDLMPDLLGTEEPTTATDLGIQPCEIVHIQHWSDARPQGSEEATTATD